MPPVVPFYRSHDQQALTAVGIVEFVDRLSDPDIILERVLKRTVYTKSEIDDLCHGDCLIILFRVQGYFLEHVDIDFLNKLGIRGAIQTIRKITDDQFRAIAKQGKIENCIFTD